MADQSEKTRGDEHIDAARNETDPVKLRAILIRCASQLDRMDYWVKEQRKGESAEEEKERRLEQRREDRERRSKEALDRARAEAIRAIAKLLPEAIAQAKGSPARRGQPAVPPKPALLRMILRATR